MKKKMVKFGIVLMLLITLTATNFMLVGANLISYALENSVEILKTNHDNVGFTAYFKTGEGEKSVDTNVDINQERMKIYLKLEIVQEGYFNGKVKLNNSNFEFVSAESENVKNVTANEIILNQINAGTSPEIEVTIKSKTSERYDLSLLSAETELELTGTYRDSNERDISISGKKNVKLNYTTVLNNESAINKINVITNKIGTYNGTKKRIIQFALQVGVNNQYPVKQITTQVNVPDIDGKQPEVIEKVDLKSMSAWNAKYENKNVTINLTNEPNAENKILYTKSGNEEIILTYIYDENVNVDNIQVIANSNITLYNENQLTPTSSMVSLNKEETDSVVTISNQVEDTIFKGRLYAGIERDYECCTSINVNLDKVAENISVIEKETSIPSKYKQTIINKGELTNLLGSNGVIEIATTTSNGELKSITKVGASTNTDESGNIVINYGEEINNLIIKTTKPQAAGIINIKHVKSIKVDNKDVIKNSKEMTSTVLGNYEPNGNIKEQATTTKLEESTTDAKLEINRNELSTVTTNKNVEIKAILKSNSEQYDLYTNPTVLIELPSDVINVEVGEINKIYGDEFTITSVNVVESNGRKAIELKLEGTQTAYKEIGIEGTILRINCNLTLNNKATSKADTVRMIYLNENVNQYKNSEAQGIEISEMNIVSPKDLITVNNIEELNLQTIGEQQLSTTTIERGAGAKALTIKSEVINNKETEINNVSVIGIIGTNGSFEINNEQKENNANIKMTTGLNIEANDTSKFKVYYTENANATSDLTNSENAWSENITGNVKKYLITISNMQIGESFKVNYGIEIPENLEYNTQAYVGYMAQFNEQTTGIEQKVNATVLELTTGQGPVIEAELKAKKGSKELANNDIVKQGETITYAITIKNTGTKETAVQVLGNVPEGTTLVKNSNQQQGIVNAGETKTVEYSVKVNKDAEINSSISGQATIKYENIEKQTNTVTNLVEEGKMSIRIESNRMTAEDEFGQKENGTITTGQTMSYTAMVENLTNEEQKNVLFTWNLPEELKIIEQTFTTQAGIIALENASADAMNYSKTIDNNKEFKIDSIPANESVKIYIVLQVGTFDEITKNVEISAKVTEGNKSYNSSVDNIKIKNNKNISIKLSAVDENEYKKAGDTIKYVMTITNNNDVELRDVLITDSIPAELSVKRIFNGNNEVTTSSNSNDISLTTNLAAGEKREIVVESLVNYIENQEDEIKIANKAKLTGNDISKETNEVTHIIAKSSINGDDPEEESKTGTYKINGIAWEDTNKDGQRQDEEPVQAGIDVQLLDVATNKIATNSQGNKITAVTKNDGTYTLSSIPNGEYIVLFGYETSSYYLTTYQKNGIEESRNSNAISKKINIDGVERLYGVTDSIKIEGKNIANINIGLIKSEKFDLRLEKFISKVAVQVGDSNKIYEYENTSLAKIELDYRKINNTNVVIEYKIKASNVGELSGYVKNIVDYIPGDLVFSSELNEEWYQQGDKLYSNVLANTNLLPGESKEITLILAKKMTESNTGLINNMAEIAEDYNESGVTDINSTPANKIVGENDLGTADLILSVKTGGTLLTITLVIAMIIVIGVVATFVRIKIKTDKDFNVNPMRREGGKKDENKK